MAVTQNTYTGNGSTTNYSFTFPYLETTDIKVSLDGSITTAYTLANATTIQFNTAPSNGAAIRIYRVTDDAGLSATFYPGSAIRSQDLNDNFTQVLYKTQETTNYSVQDSGNVTLSGNYTFDNTVSGQTPTGSNNLATKGYVDGVAFASGNLVPGNKGDITVNSANSWTINASLSYLSSADIGVTVQAYDATTLKSADIGSTVQAYDADTTKNDVANSFSALQTFTAGIDNNGVSYRSNITAMGALDIDCSTANYFTKTINANSTFTVSNVPSSRAYAFTLELTHTSGTVTWFSGVQWPTNVAPTLTTGKVHLFTFITDDGGTSWRGTSQINYSS